MRTFLTEFLNCYITFLEDIAETKIFVIQLFRWKSIFFEIWPFQISKRRGGCEKAASLRFSANIDFRFFCRYKAELSKLCDRKSWSSPSPTLPWVGVEIKLKIDRVMAVLVPKLKIASVHILKILRLHAFEQKSIFSHIERYRRDMNKSCMVKSLEIPRRSFASERSIAQKWILTELWPFYCQNRMRLGGSNVIVFFWQ